MGKKKDKGEKKDKDTRYKDELRALQIELVKMQRDVIAKDKKLVIVLEGRDAGGKDGAIKRITEHLSPRETRVIALGKPSDRDRSSWYFQRYVQHLPAADEIVLFNRSWYNRAGVERVMGFCEDTELETFFETVGPFEHMLIGAGIRLLKYYLDITKDEQKRRLDARHEDPLKQWKLSPIDAVANERWDDYSKARNIMLARTSTAYAPWRIVVANDKKAARINLIKDILTRVDYDDKDEALVAPDPKIVFEYNESYLANGMIAP